ncbi:MAG: DEAD/DEAH box helicase family protein [Deltaproteobacteria bacterium]|nr:DEAD/DEAH box helicase family protein [Deltaproteobacteria bacterium]
MNIWDSRGVAVREFKLTSGHGFADYLLFVDGKAVGVLEAKPAGHTLSGVEVQAARYSDGLPANLDPPVTPLPFLYLSTGTITRFTNLLDPHPRSRGIFNIHRPEALAEWLTAPSAAAGRPSTLRGRLQHLPPLERAGLFANQVKAVVNLEQSLKDDRARSLIQMATGSGKTIMAITAVYRLIKHGGARRVLFLVDRGNLGEQAEKEFQGYRTPDDKRKFPELYNVQRLTSNTIGASSKVVISTVQRLYSILKGEPELAPGTDDQSLFEAAPFVREPLPVVYNETYPPEYFDVIVVDECHRSIYSLWRQVLEYFDAYLIGLTATPAKHTFGFFNQNLVMEYPHEQAVAEGVNVDFEVYRIRTKITEAGSIIAAAEEPVVGYRSRATRAVRWQALDDDLPYGAGDLDRAVVAKDQIRLIVRTFRDRLFKDIFPGRTEVPKTLVFAKDDSHAEDIVDIIREEFGLGNDFCQKITYKTTGKKPADLIQSFRTSYWPRVAVTVDMIATGTDIRPVEIVVFMRSVQSRVLFEQMKGRGVRVIQPDELRAVTPDAHAKTHFAIVDCVGVTETDLADSQPLEKKKGVALKALLEHVAAGGVDPEVLSSLASRLARLHKACGPAERARMEEAAGGVSLTEISAGLVEAVDPDHLVAEARRTFGVPSDREPTADQLKKTAAAVGREATRVLATKPALRAVIQDVKRELEQVIDEVSKDELLEAGISEVAKEKARALVTSFEQFIADNKDEIEALQFFYSVPHARRLRYKDIKTLAETIKAPPRSWTPEVLWRAYETLERDRVRGGSSKRMLTDIVSLVRFALHRDDALRPYPEQVRERFTNWMAQQANSGRQFTVQQVHWLEMIRDHVALSLEIDVEDFDYAPFAEEGGRGKAAQVFGENLPTIIAELNEVLAA